MAKINELKKSNMRSIRRCFYNGQVWIKNDLADSTGLSLAAITNMIQILTSKQEVFYIGDAESKVGRKAKKYRINPDYRHIGGLLIEKGSIKGVIYNLYGEIIYEKDNAYSSINTIEEMIEDMRNFDRLFDLLTIAMPAVIVDGKISESDIEELNGVNLKRRLEERFEIEVYMDSCVNISALSLLKKYPQTYNMVYCFFTKQTHTRCGFILNRDIYHGSSSFAGTLGYLPQFSNHEQKVLMNEDPMRLLENDLKSVCCIVDPEIITVYSDVDDLDLDRVFVGIPLRHHPKIVLVKDPVEDEKIGLYIKGKEILLASM